MSRNLSVNPPLDILLFLRAGLRKPRSLGAVAPSGRALARLVTSEIAPGGGPVIELGAGTGAVTRALLERVPTPLRPAAGELEHAGARVHVHFVNVAHGGGP